MLCGLVVVVVVLVLVVRKVLYSFSHCW